jgi:excisionase family DNA binding protein
MGNLEKVLTLPERIEGMNRAMKVSELAKLLSLSRQRVYELIDSGQLPALRLGGAIRLDSTLVATWLRKNAA